MKLSIHSSDSAATSEWGEQVLGKGHLLRRSGILTISLTGIAESKSNVEDFDVDGLDCRNNVELRDKKLVGGKQAKYKIP